MIKISGMDDKMKINFSHGRDGIISANLRKNDDNIKLIQS